MHFLHDLLLAAQASYVGKDHVNPILWLDLSHAFLKQHFLSLEHFLHICQWGSLVTDSRCLAYEMHYQLFVCLLDKWTEPSTALTAAPHGTPGDR